MPLPAFVSYSHADEKAWERLRKHLAMLERDSLIFNWYDGQILPRDKIAGEIRNELDRSEIFLALVSPDYLASQYCYEKEFQHALELARSGRLRLIPVILEPCDWLSSPLSEFMALPRDGKPISEWTNVNIAYLDVVSGLRRIVQHAPNQAPVPERTEPAHPTRQIKLQRDFDAIERLQFADGAFNTIKEYFRAAAAELAQVSDELRTHFEEMSPTAFTCSLVNRAKQRGGESHITVHNMKGRQGYGEIIYSQDRYAETKTMNGVFNVEADDYNLFLSDSGFSWNKKDSSRLSPERAAETLWNDFVSRAGVEYE